MGWGRKFCVLRARLDINSLTTTVHPIGNRQAFAAPQDCRTLCSVGIIASLKMGVIAWLSPRISDARATDSICHQSQEHAPSSRRRRLSARILNTLASPPPGDWRCVSEMVIAQFRQAVSHAPAQSEGRNGTIVPLIGQMRHSGATNGANDSALCR
jgi:hypothetical protein